MSIIAAHQKTGGQILKLGDTLYLSFLQTSSDSPRRGGIPLVFPQFGNSGKLQKHGFARNVPWTLLQEIMAPCGD
jgi:glucose-6-phosphate 1-epimerase